MNELEVIKKIKNDFEYWSARELMKVLGYVEWRKFEATIKKAKIACAESDHDVMGHFVDADKMVDLGLGTKRKTADYMLTRYACYLIAQNGDSRKPEIARAQTYFAVQTRKQEINPSVTAYAATPSLDRAGRNLLLGLYGGIGITTLN